MRRSLEHNERFEFDHYLSPSSTPSDDKKNMHLYLSDLHSTLAALALRVTVVLLASTITTVAVKGTGLLSTTALLRWIQ